jgi:hypothetical protein
MKRSTVFAGLVVGALLVVAGSARAQEFDGAYFKTLYKATNASDKGKISFLGEEKTVEMQLYKPVPKEEGRVSEPPPPPNAEDVAAYVNNLRKAVVSQIGINISILAPIVGNLKQLNVKLGQAPGGSGYFGGIHFDTINKALDVYYSEDVDYSDLRARCGKAMNDLVECRKKSSSNKGGMNDQEKSGTGINKLK